MNIIFGTELAQEAQDRYTVLELDTFYIIPTDKTITAYCLVENIPVQEMASIESLKLLHFNLMTEYKKRNWHYCEDVIQHLTGKWNGDVDSFYQELYNRIQNLKKQNLDTEWSSTIKKS